MGGEAERKLRPRARGVGDPLGRQDETHRQPASGWHSAPQAGQRAWTVPNQTASWAGLHPASKQKIQHTEPTTKGGGWGCTLQNILNLKTNEKLVPGRFYFRTLLREQFYSSLYLLVLLFHVRQKARHGIWVWQGPGRFRSSEGGVHPGPRCLGLHIAGGLLCRARTDDAGDKWLLSTHELNAFNFWPSGLSGSLICPGQCKSCDTIPG